MFSTIAAGAIAVVVVLTVLLLGMDVATEFATSEPPPESINFDSPFVLTPPSTLFLYGLITVGIGGMLAIQALGTTPGEDSGQSGDGITILKNEYIDGEMELDEFEDRVYDEIEVEI